MRAAVLDEFGGRVTVDDVSDPRPGPNEVLVDVRGCGVGLTLERARTGSLGGSTPRVVGHELAGVVAEPGAEVEHWAPGDRVTCSFYLTCGLCRMCASGRETLCESFGGYVGCHVDGGLAEFVALPSWSLVGVPDEVELSKAGIVADAVATPFHVFTTRSPVQPGQVVAVIGAGGGVGVHMALMARAFGADVVAVERDPDKVEGLQGLGFGTIFNPESDDGWATRLRRELGAGVDVCVDTVAAESTLRNGVGLLGSTGRLVIVGFQAGVTWEVDPRPLLLGEAVVTGSRYATRAEIAASLDLVATGRVPLVVGATYTLEETPEAYRAMQQNEVFGRLLVDCSS